LNLIINVCSDSSVKNTQL